MAEKDDSNRSEWGVSKTTKEMLDEYHDELLKLADYNDKEEIKYFLHSTIPNGKKSIERSGKLCGGKTDHPAKAPLASCFGLKGIWFEMSSKKLPFRSPYGTQRIKFSVRDIMTYMSRQLKDVCKSDDQWDSTETDQEDDKKRQKLEDQRDEKKPSLDEKHLERQKDCQMQKVQEKPNLLQPLLFFEHAHYYGTNQYVRLLLAHPSDPNIEWCREFCKELDIKYNPFLRFKNGRIYTYTTGNGSKLFIEVLVVGDIVFSELLEPPTWDVVGTVPRAGSEPRCGVYSRHH